jgi:hypothetical protein
MDFYGLNIKPTGKYILDGNNSFGDTTGETYLWVYQSNPEISSGVPIRYDYPNDPYIGIDAYFANKGYLPLRLIKNDSMNPLTASDNDGNTYDTVKIGSQVWMASNFAGVITNLGNQLILSSTDADAVTNINALSYIECEFNFLNTFYNIIGYFNQSKINIIP